MIYALQFMIYSTFVREKVKKERFECPKMTTVTGQALQKLR